MTVDGEAATFDLRPPAPPEGPPSPSDLGGEGPGGDGLAAALAEHALVAYARALEREVPPELIISLPAAVQERAG